MNRLTRLARQGQQIWLDYIRRSFIESGELEEAIRQGVRGITSNPSIFEKAIAGSADYDRDLAAMARQGLSTGQIYESLVVEDIRRAADIFRPYYEESDGMAGYVSLEVDPRLAHDTEGTVSEALRLFQLLERPNVMIKIPATEAGCAAIRRVLAQGVNVNVTLIFSVEQYAAVAEAYLDGLEAFIYRGGDPRRLASVASVFVSRLDTAVDRVLEHVGHESLEKFGGRAAVDNARLLYFRFGRIFSGSRWEALAAKGARLQRPLWASTGTKNPLYSDVLYVDSLVGPHTVNTLPPATLTAYLDHGSVEPAVEEDLAGARERVQLLSEMDVDLHSIMRKLLNDGLESFEKAFSSLMESIAAKRAQVLSGERVMEARLGVLQDPVDLGLEVLKNENVLHRLWDRDHTLWKPDPAEISNRLGWLHVVDEMDDEVARLEELARDLCREGYRDVLLLGMGGSSLAPELFARTFREGPGRKHLTPHDGLRLHVLDSTDPGAVLSWTERLDPSTTFYVVSSKSGGTVETLSFYRYFFSRAVHVLGEEGAGLHFAAVTDPGSRLEAEARSKGFREVFLNDPNLGGRYSALSFFGLVPAALAGVDVPLLLERARRAMENAEPCNCPVKGNNRAAMLGVILGEAAKKGCNKVTFLLSPSVASLGDWLEQLIAESTGKEGRGILPVVGEPVNFLEFYGKDRIFVHIRLDGEGVFDDVADDLVGAGYPVLTLHLRDVYDVGAQFFLWETATAIAGWRLGINPFDQPDVESAKVKARETVTAFAEKGRLPSVRPRLEEDGIRLYGDVHGKTPEEAFRHFLALGGRGSYVALQAWLRPEPGTEETFRILQGAVRDRTRHAVTFGWGPRFLHSTGQLHKGDDGKGLFIQFKANGIDDAGIPETAGGEPGALTFGILKEAQSRGDRQALEEKGRKVLTIDLGGDVTGGVERFIAALR